eukprot:TRINITY_DN67547_c0_g1_i9.p1 TRINITY_DN67547_c0_g1~~TRINITY_DN67547_c0_g1_i9.p1  ORF type:complete len:832 (+),score=376.43 TRINITY_DN67547_c0_g1_i9:31-2526(+)
MNSKQLLLLTAVSAVVVGCTPAAAATVPKEVYIGGIMPLGLSPQFVVLTDLTQMALEDINNDTSILPNTTLKMYVNSSGRASPNTAIRSWMWQTQTCGGSSNPAIAVVAGAYTDPSVPMSYMATEYKVPFLSPMLADDVFNNKAYHSYFYRTTPPTSAGTNVFVALMRKYGWTRAVVLTRDDDAGRSIHSTMATLAKDTSTGPALDLLMLTADMKNKEDYEAKLQTIKDSSYRVIFSTTVGGHTVFEYMRSIGLLKKEYAWVANAWCDSPVNTLTHDDVAGFMCIRPLPAGGPAWDAWVARARQRPLQKYVPSIGFYQGGFYDIGWIIGHALHKMFHANASNVVAATGENLKTYIAQTDMTGVIGNIKFDALGNPVRNFQVVNYQAPTPSTLPFVLWWNRVVFTYSMTDKKLSQQVTAPVFLEGSTTVPPDAPVRTLLRVSGGLYYTFVSLMAVGVALAVVFAALIQKNTKHPVIRSSSPLFCQVIVLGSIILLCTIAVVGLDKDTAGVCESLPLLASVGFWLIVAPSFAKTYRLHKIFNNKKLRIQKIPNSRLLMEVGLTVLMELVWYALFMGVGKPTAKLVAAEGQLYTDVYVCDNEASAAWWVLFVAPKALMLIASGRQAYQVRNLVHSFNESKQIAYTIYTIGLLSLIALPLGQMQRTAPDSALVIVGGCLWFGTVSVLMFMFGIKFFNIYVSEDWRLADKNAFVQTNASNGSRSSCSPSHSRAGKHTRSRRAGSSVAKKAIEKRQQRMNQSSTHSRNASFQQDRPSKLKQVAMVQPRMDDPPSPARDDVDTSRGVRTPTQTTNAEPQAALPADEPVVVEGGDDNRV